jgi:hypothetical protein
MLAAMRRLRGHGRHVVLIVLAAIGGAALAAAGLAVAVGGSGSGGNAVTACVDPNGNVRVYTPPTCSNGETPLDLATPLTPQESGELKAAAASIDTRLGDVQARLGKVAKGLSCEGLKGIAKRICEKQKAMAKLAQAQARVEQQQQDYLDSLARQLGLNP